jgi:hypothetical protein
MYWAAKPLEKASTIVTGLHVDGNFFADALHAHMEGYNEVVLFHRVDIATLDKLCKISAKLKIPMARPTKLKTILIKSGPWFRFLNI